MVTWVFSEVISASESDSSVVLFCLSFGGCWGSYGMPDSITKKRSDWSSYFDSFCSDSDQALTGDVALTQSLTHTTTHTHNHEGLLSSDITSCLSAFLGLWITRFLHAAAIPTSQTNLFLSQQFTGAPKRKKVTLWRGGIFNNGISHWAMAIRKREFLVWLRFAAQVLNWGKKLCLFC